MWWAEPSKKTTDDGVEWRKCDLFSLLDTEQPLLDMRFTLFTPCSRPSSRRQAFVTSTGSGRQLFTCVRRSRSRAIIYLGGLSFHPTKASRAPRSRPKCPSARFTLSGRDCLQAGLIIGVGGSSMRIAPAGAAAPHDGVSTLDPVHVSTDRVERRS